MTTASSETAVAAPNARDETTTAATPIDDATVLAAPTAIAASGETEVATATEETTQIVGGPDT